MSNRLRILLVEDEPVIVAAATRALVPEGFHVDQAQDVPQALAHLKGGNYALILCDLMLPQISGLELVKTVTRDHPLVPVVMVTGYVTLENAIQSFDAGAFDFIPKPFDINELLGVVYRGIAHFRLQQETASPTLPASPAAPENTYFLGGNSWARVDPDGLCAVGVGNTFPNRMGDVHEILFPPLQSELLQGNTCVTLVSGEDHINKVWAPVSGKVVALNEPLQQNRTWIDSDPQGRGWLLKLLPTNLKPELESLHQGRRS